MDHLDVQLAHRMLRGQLDPEAQARWERHLQECPRCRELLAGERALMTMLDLGEEPAPPASPDVGRLLDRVEGLTPQAAARRRRRIAVTVGGLLAVAALTILLGWQLRNTSARSAAGAEELHIPPELEEKVIINFNALATLERDPWLADQYEAVRMLEQLITRHRP